MDNAAEIDTCNLWLHRSKFITNIHSLAAKWGFDVWPRNGPHNANKRRPPPKSHQAKSYTQAFCIEHSRDVTMKSGG
eukprot:scaffold269710_cov31-Prasinocladus_malaysianus.AAC.1